MTSAKAGSKKRGAGNGSQTLAPLVSEIPYRIPVLIEELAIVRAHLGEAIDRILSSALGEDTPQHSEPHPANGLPPPFSKAPPHASRLASVEQLVGGSTK